MQMTRIRMSIGGLLLAVVSSSIQADALQPDPAWQEGKLDNGFSWQFLATPQRPGDNTELRLVVATGSLMETPQQTGFSYLIPQIALRFSASLTSAQLQRFWQQVQHSSSAIPSVVNSYGFTMFSLSLPNNRPELLKEALAWLADSVGRLPINDETVSVVNRVQAPMVTFPANISDPWWRYRLKGSVMLGHDPVRPAATVDSRALAEFYQQSYTPDVMTLHIVGNIDSRSLNEQLNKQFAGLRGHRETPATIPTLTPISSQPVNLIGESGTQDTLSLVWDRSWGPILDERALLRHWLSNLAQEGMFSRLQRLTEDNKKSNLKLGAGCSVLFQRAQCAIHLNTPQSSLKSSLEMVAKSLQSLETSGLTQAEFDTLLTQKKDQLGQLFATYARINTEILINQRLVSQQSNMVDIAPEKYQHLRKSFLSSLTREKLNMELHHQLALPPVLVLIQPEGEPEENVKDLAALYNTIVEPLPPKETP